MPQILSESLSALEPRPFNEAEAEVLPKLPQNHPKATQLSPPLLRAPGILEESSSSSPHETLLLKSRLPLASGKWPSLCIYNLLSLIGKGERG